MRLHWYQSRNFGDALSPRVVAMLLDTMLIWHRMNAKICGVSMWASLRRHFSVGEIVYHRALVYVVRCPGVRHLVRYLLLAVHHPGVWKLMEIRSRRLCVGRERRQD